jgi:N-methylhydantoinase A
MADLLRRMTVERGFDPKTFTLFANGGAGPSHAWSLAADLGLDGFVVPAAATALSALGTAVSDFQFSTERATYVRIQGSRTISGSEAATIERGLREASSEVSQHLAAAARTGIRVECFASIRYLGQTHSLDVPIAADRFGAPEFGALVEGFRRLYASLFGMSATYAKAGYEILSVRAVGTGALTPPALASKGDEPRAGKLRRVVFDNAVEAVECAVWHTSVPRNGWYCEGPCIIEFAGQSAVVPPKASVAADHIGNLRVRFGS